MKVLILGTDLFSKGGIQRYSRYQYNAIQELFGQKNTYLFSLKPKNKNAYSSFEENIKIHYCGNGLSFVSKLKYLLATLAFVKKNRINLIICTHVQLSIIAFLCRLLFNSKYVVNVYGIEIWSGLNSLNKFFLLKADQIIGDCKFIINYINLNLRKTKKTTVLYDPVDLNKFKKIKTNEAFRKKFGIPKGKFIVMTVGRLERNKGHEIIIKALVKLPKNIIYVIVGTGLLETFFKNLVELLKLEERVIFLGSVSDNDLSAIYNQADVVSLLSTYSKLEGEGLPMGLIEASACSKPIICGNQDGSIEAFNKKNTNGILINPTKIISVIKSINFYYKNKPLLKKHGRNGRKFVVDNFSFKIFKHKFKQIIEKL